MLIEIMQDSAGVIEQSNQMATGFYTGGIENCLVTTYQCEGATILIHDSGQLSVGNICDLIKQYGTVKKITASFGAQLNCDHHQARFNTIQHSIGWDTNENIDVLQSKCSPFAFIYPIDGRPTIMPNLVPSSVIQISHKERRQSVIELNNFFLAPNAQSLNLDVQYINGCYADPRNLDFSLEKIIEIVRLQPEFFFANLAFLSKADSIGVVSLPQELRDIATESDVTKFAHERLDADAVCNQQKAFNKYMGH